ncbi:hypothetical protein JDO7802_03364 [Jannaschia donghaensis]|uniref:Sulfotransferase family protein n=2 Tax=Jannaschia donghaensis TaxID=420998 RepID=A0A0M6YNV5_9RHOB|nr:hypothetical protein JDO7802_03364 [Jannaschia donghaensis]
MPHLTATPPVTLHLGAHRTGTTAVQHLLRRNDEYLAARGIATWGPDRTRGGMLGGIGGDPGRIDARRNVRAHRAAGRIAMLRAQLATVGTHRIVLSDENLLGGLRENLLLCRLYPTVTTRLDRVAAAIPGIDHVVLSIRSPDAWWTSAFACLMTRGFAAPDRATLDAVLRTRRSWRAVVTDVAAALPHARLTVWTHEDMATRADAAVHRLTGEVPQVRNVARLNASPDCATLQARLLDEGCVTRLPDVAGHYAPFSPDERASLRGRYDDDLAWLRDGADGLIEMETPATTSPAEGPFRDRRPRYGRDRRQEAMGATG